MSGMADVLGKTLIVKFATGDLRAVGKCVSYCSAPTVTVELASGEQITWRMDLCSIAADDPAVTWLCEENERLRALLKSAQDTTLKALDKYQGAIERMAKARA